MKITDGEQPHRWRKTSGVGATAHRHHPTVASQDEKRKQREWRELGGGVGKD